MSRMLGVALVLFASVLGGCKKGEDGNGNGPDRKSRGTIGYSALEMTNPFFVIIGDTMKEEAKKHGYDMIVVSGDRKVSKQAEQIDDFIAKGVVAIVINPCDSKTIGPAIKRANDAGIPVFTNDIKYDGDEAKVITHVATDNYQGGKLAGEAMVKAIGKTGGEVAIINFPQVESCQLRVKGFNEILEQHNKKADSNKITVVSNLDGRGERKAGYDAATAQIEANPNLAAIFAINDPSALGAYAALEEAEKVGKVVIIGFDGELAGKQAILEGKILCDPVQFPDQIARKTIDSMMKYFGGTSPESEILIPSKIYYQKDAKIDPALKKKGEQNPKEAE